MWVARDSGSLPGGRLDVGKEICIDNGGTLTDIVVFDGAEVHTTKTLTTPFDLSQCFFDGLRKISRTLYGDEDVQRLLSETASIRYSTTQGTNALVERKGPRLGMVLSVGFDLDRLRPDAGHERLLADLVGTRVQHIAMSMPAAERAAEVIACVNALAASGATRILVCLSGADYAQHEREWMSGYEDCFPPHHLGTVPVAVSHEISGDADEARRIWTAILNSFLHPPMEQFLFGAHKRLRNFRGGATLRIFRNDGGSAKVAKTTAIKTYSSGPRAGMEAVQAAARRLGFTHVISVDVGGTTSDLGSVEDGRVRTCLRGQVEGVETSVSLCDIVSLGIGGGSIIRAENDRIHVGPRSVGAAPGPACFGLGGTQATITDAALALGLLDPESFFGGGMRLDLSRAQSAIDAEVGRPLGLDVIEAAQAMVVRWVEELAAGVRRFAPAREETVLMAFGGAGPLLMCDVAEALGIRRILVPRLAAMYSAYGVGFSEVAQEYERALPPDQPEAVAQVLHELRLRAERDMAAEGIDFAGCSLRLSGIRAGVSTPLDPSTLSPQSGAFDSLQLRVSAPPSLPPGTAVTATAFTVPASRASTRHVHRDAAHGDDIPVFRLSACLPGSGAHGPAVVEGEYFTGYLKPGWRFSVIESGDCLLDRITP